MRLIATAGAALLALFATTSAAGPTPTVVPVTVDPGTQISPLNHDLVGFGWHAGGAPLEAVEPLDPHFVRLDASLQDVSVAAGAPLRLDDLSARVAEIRAIGAEPLVILSYMPAWLGAPNAGGRDPTRVAPADLDAWERVIHDVVIALATAPGAARWFEAWNEPDVPLFWQDTPSRWVDTVERTARAIASVEEETGLDLQFAGPATAVPDPIYLEPFLLRFRDPALPLDAVTWHYYGNYPFFGPDGAEFPITEPIQPLLGQQNPLASPSAYGGQIDLMRAWVEAGLAGTERLPPALVLDEWNLSAAGFDRRHDTAEGAAFAAGVLIDMHAAGLDASAFFRANDTRGVPGEHGAVTLDGTPKPTWWTFWLWQRLAAVEVAVAGSSDLDGLWAIASADGTRSTVLVASFSASSPTARTIELDVQGGPPASTAVIHRIDAEHPSSATGEPLAIDGSVVRFELPPQAVALIEMTTPSAEDLTIAAGGERGSPLPATGTGAPRALCLLAAGALLAAIVGCRLLTRVSTSVAAR